MRPAPSPAPTPAVRTGNLAKRASAAARKARLRRVTLEALEERALMAVLPAPLTGSLADVSQITGGSGGNESAPTIVIDPADPTKMVRSGPGTTRATSAGRTPGRSRRSSTGPRRPTAG